jgi:Flp pilus assembly protein TadD
VFSSKSRGHYTKMFLTHVDEQGNDTPALLIENSTAANRAVNIPEFVNIPPDGLLRIDAPVTEYYRLIDVASETMNKGDHEAALPLLRQALAESPGDAVVHNSYGSALAATGRLAEAVAQYRKAAALAPDYPEAHNNLASALVQSGRTGEAVSEFEKALALKPDLAESHAGLGGLLAQKGKVNEAIPHLQKAVELGPENPMALGNLCLALSLAGRPQEAIPRAQQAVALTNGQDPLLLDMLGRLYAQAGRVTEALEPTRQALEIARRAGDVNLARELQGRLSTYEATAGSGPIAAGRTPAR